MKKEAKQERECGLHEGLTLHPLEEEIAGVVEQPLSALLTGRLPLRVKAAQLAYKLRRRRLRAPGRKLRYYDARPTSEAQMEAVLAAIAAAKSSDRPTVAVLAPHFEDDTLSKGEGYVRRIAEIDRRVLSGCLRVYLYESPYYRVDRVVADRMAENCLYIRYNANYRYHRDCVRRIVEACGVCYSHSVLRLIPAQEPQRPERWLDIFTPGVRHILDVHGAVPQESRLCGDEDTARYAEKAQALYFAHAAEIIVLTEAMAAYYKREYGCEQARFTVLTVFSADIASGVYPDKAPLGASRPAAVFAGGCQPWQNVPLMQDAMRARAGELDFYMCVTQPAVFMAQWGGEPLPANAEVGTRTPREIVEIYKKSRYGFLLRDDSVVNRVACPTKLIEYICYGILPVLLSPDVGDFAAMGLAYLPYEDLLRGALPAEEERAAMARKNIEILREMLRQYECTAALLRGRIEGKE